MIYQCEMWFAIRRMLDTSCRRCTFLQNWLCTESAVCSRPSSVKITNVRSCKPCFFRSFSNAGFCIVCLFLWRKCNQHSLYLFWGEAVEKCNQCRSNQAISSVHCWNHLHTCMLSTKWNLSIGQCPSYNPKLSKDEIEIWGLRQSKFSGGGSLQTFLTSLFSLWPH